MTGGDKRQPRYSYRGAGNYTVWIHRFYRYRQLGTQLARTLTSAVQGTAPASTGERVPLES